MLQNLNVFIYLNLTNSRTLKSSVLDSYEPFVGLFPPKLIIQHAPNKHFLFVLFIYLNFSRNLIILLYHYYYY